MPIGARRPREAQRCCHDPQQRHGDNDTTSRYSQQTDHPPTLNPGERSNDHVQSRTARKRLIGRSPWITRRRGCWTKPRCHYRGRHRLTTFRLPATPAQRHGIRTAAKRTRSPLRARRAPRTLGRDNAIVGSVGARTTADHQCARRGGPPTSSIASTRASGAGTIRSPHFSNVANPATRLGLLLSVVGYVEQKLSARRPEPATWRPLRGCSSTDDLARTSPPPGPLAPSAQPLRRGFWRKPGKLRPHNDVGVFPHMTAKQGAQRGRSEACPPLLPRNLGSSATSARRTSRSTRVERRAAEVNGRTMSHARTRALLSGLTRYFCNRGLEQPAPAMRQLLRRCR